MDRVTGNSIGTSVLSANQQTLARMATYQTQLSTNKKLIYLSDDPVAAKQSMRYRGEGLQVQKYLDNIDKAQAFMQATDSSLGEMSQVLDEAKALAVQGTNGTQDAASRKTLAASVDSLLTRMIDLGNTVHDGRYLFAGTATTQTAPPFARNATDDGVDYRGTLDNFEVAIGPTSKVQVNQDGYTLFGTDTFKSLIEIRDALKANDPATLNSKITGLDTVHDRLNGLQGAMGGRQQRLELAQSQLENTKVYLGELVSKAEDVDMTEVISKMNLTQVALQAGLQAGAKVMQTSLIDFLR